MEDQQVGQEGPISLGEQGHQIALDLHRVVVKGETQSLAQPSYVSIDRYSYVDSEGISQHHVRGLASHSRKRVKLFHGIGNLPAMVRDEGLRHSDQVLGLVAEESG